VLMALATAVMIVVTSGVARHVARSWVWTIGIIVVVIGAELAIAGFAGRDVAGSRHWY
jgi:hypothetical protein